jgi:hypothetical protein
MASSGQSDRLQLLLRCLPPAVASTVSRDKFVAALGHLTQLERRVIELQYASGLTSGETAAVLQLSKLRVPMVRNRAINRLRSLLENRSPNPNVSDSRRTELLNKKYSSGLDLRETEQLAGIEEALQDKELRVAESASVRKNHRLDRIDADLERVEKILRELQTTSQH